MRAELIRFFAALRFFTRLPAPAWVGHSAEALDGAARYFPAVGILVGALGAAATLAATFLWPPSVAVLLGMAATLLATGAFHEDGLADTIDGLGGGFSREKALAIMKDSRLGSFGALGITLVLLLKFELLSALLGAVLPWPTFCAQLIAAHAVSRFAATTLIHGLDYARTDENGSKAKPLVTRMSQGELLLAGVFGLLPCLMLPLAQAMIAILLVALVTALLARHFVRRLGGYTGDCLGATQQLAEIAFYLGLVCAST